MSSPKAGIGAVHSTVTQATSNVFGIIDKVASGCNAIASDFETKSWLTNAETAYKICNKYGIKKDDGTTLTLVEAVKSTKELVAELRGY